MRICIAIILSLAIGGVAFSDVIVKGKRVIYELTGRTLTEGPTAPTDPQEGEQFRNITTNDLYTYTNSTWELEKKNQIIKDAIVEYKAEVALIPDAHTKKAVKSLGKIVLRLYRESE